MEKENHQIHPLSQQESEDMWENVISRIRVQEANKKKKKRTLYSIIATTAAILIVGSILIFKFYPTQEIYQAKETEISIVLKDGTRVTLLKGSKLTVEDSFPQDTRDVFLDGNAIFNVTKSKQHPFIVHGKDYDTKVMGTIFRVAQNGSTFNVDLYEGKVQVINSKKKEQTFVLHPRETFSNLGSLKVASIKPTRIQNQDIKASTATLSLKDISLMDAMQIIEKTYGVKIKFQENNAQSVISVTKENATAADLLNLISIQLNLKIKSIDAKTFELEN
ncbi:hypothetical protein DRF65_13920 [Chryseobacterium pennae]|uniref:Uncharacterized protein n=1 Tax=Chryseobacterium pennae TaxID=2258962 RepID=A0A3D9C7G7_9FLAO|nr:FecR family protein [Chryseobacterium pennae]REC61830.1 hypothetical protein DRF65_13920 [Chryseobacterium pennae]